MYGEHDRWMDLRKRFMGTPQQNPEGYKVSSPLQYIGGVYAYCGAYPSVV